MQNKTGLHLAIQIMFICLAMDRIRRCTFIQMTLQIFSLPKIQLSLCHCSHIDRTASGPGTSQPENVFELRDKPIWNAPESLYTAGQGFSGVAVIDAQSSLNHSWGLYLRAMRTAWADRTQPHSYSLTPTLALIPGIPSWLCCIAAQTQYPFHRTDVLNILLIALLSHTILWAFC